MACPQTIVQLYRGVMTVCVNQSGVYEGATAVVEHQDKDQAAGLEMTGSFILCGHQAFKTHIKSIAVFILYMRMTKWKSPKAVLLTRRTTAT
jgi:hypothetical protein